MTRALARDLGESNIRVNCVVPGAIRTPRQMKLWHTPEEEAKILAQQCLKARVDPCTSPRWCCSWPPTTRAMCTAHNYWVDARLPLTRDVSMSATVECVWPVGAVLGEGPVWSAAEQAVWFVDIKAPAIHRFHPRQRRTAHPGRRPRASGFVLPTRDGWLIAGLKTGLHRFNPGDRQFHAAARRRAARA